MMPIDWEYWQLVADIIWLYLILLWYKFQGLPWDWIRDALLLYWLCQHWVMKWRLAKLQADKAAQDRVLDNLLTTIFRLRKQAKEQ